MPRAKAPSATGSASAAAGPAIPRVFVVDDYAPVRQALCRLLETAGFLAEGYASADEFLSRPRHAGPSCLLLDLQLPGMSGMELRERLREEKRRIPIIFLSGHDAKAATTAHGSRGLRVLAKPVSAGELFAAVRRALNGRRRASPRAGRPSRPTRARPRR